MDKISINDIIKGTKGKLISGPYLDSKGDSDGNFITGVTIDSRRVKQGDLFVAIPGEKTDGHNFLMGAKDKGALCALISKEEFGIKDLNCILVEDAVTALQELGKWYISNLRMKKIGVTGSVGKTTTRDFVHAAVSGKYKAGKNSGNLNNDIGLPLTILTFDSTMDVGVMEMGTMGAMGEIHRLADIGRPDAAIITNIGVSHMETLGSRDNILKTKLEVADFFGKDNSLILNYDDDKLSTIRDEDYSFKIIKVGTKGNPNKLDYEVSDVKDYGLDGVTFTLNTPGGEYGVRLPIPGSHNALNAALAIAGASAMGVNGEDAIKGIALMETTGNRLRKIEKNGFKILDDSYNAAPVSMKSAVTTLANSQAARRIAILGDMYELGADSEKMHFEVGEFVAKSKMDILITIGEKARLIGEGCEEAKSETGSSIEIRSFETKEEFYPIMKNLFKAGDLILVKASRGMKLDQLVGKIEEL